MVSMARKKDQGPARRYGALPCNRRNEGRRTWGRLDPANRGAARIQTTTPTVFMLHRSDILVRSQASELKRRSGYHEVLQYLLVDGQFRGAVLGHWRIGPYDVENIILELPAGEREARQEEVLQAVRWGYRPPNNDILRHDGKLLGRI